MSKTIYETENYIYTIHFGSGFKLKYKMKRKSPEENIEYRKRKGLDVYDNNNTLIGECKRINRTWMCLIPMDNTMYSTNMLNELILINSYINKQNLNLPKIDSIVTKNNITYYSWYHNEKGFFIKNQIHNEIKIIKTIIDKYFEEKMINLKVYHSLN